MYLCWSENNAKWEARESWFKRKYGRVYDIEIVWNDESIGSSERGFQASLGGCLSRSPPSTFALIDKSGYLRRALLKSFKSSEFHPGFTWISYNYYVNAVVASISTVNSTAFYLFWINVLDCKPVYGSCTDYFKNCI